MTNDKLKTTVVKRADFVRENKRSAEALSPPPPVSLRIGESGSLVVKVCRAASVMWTSVYVHAVVRRVAETFTTSTLLPVKAPQRDNSLQGKHL